MWAEPLWLTSVTPGQPKTIVAAQNARLPALLSSLDEQHLLNDCTAAKSLQSCPTLCDPTDGSPPGSAVLGILQARTHWRSITSWAVSSLCTPPTNHNLWAGLHIDFDFPHEASGQCLGKRVKKRPSILVPMSSLTFPTSNSQTRAPQAQLTLPYYCLNS